MDKFFEIAISIKVIVLFHLSEFCKFFFWNKWNFIRARKVSKDYICHFPCSQKPIEVNIDRRRTVSIFSYFRDPLAALDAALAASDGLPAPSPPAGLLVAPASVGAISCTFCTLLQSHWFKLDVEFCAPLNWDPLMDGEVGAVSFEWWP